MNKIFIILPTLLLNLGFASAQESQLAHNPVSVDFSTQSSFAFRTKSEDVEILGDPYLGNNLSSYTLKGVDTSDVNFLRYNYFTDELEFMKDDVVYDLMHYENAIFEFPKLNKKFVYVSKYEYDKKVKSGYLEILSNGKEIALLKKTPVNLNEKLVKADAYDTGTKVKEYKASKPVYFIKQGNDVREIPKKKDEFINLFADQNTRNFIKSDKISSTSESDLLKLINYINK